MPSSLYTLYTYDSDNMEYDLSLELALVAAVFALVGGALVRYRHEIFRRSSHAPLPHGKKKGFHSIIRQTAENVIAYLFYHERNSLIADKIARIVNENESNPNNNNPTNRSLT